MVVSIFLFVVEVVGGDFVLFVRLFVLFFVVFIVLLLFFIVFFTHPFTNETMHYTAGLS